MAHDVNAIRSFLVQTPKPEKILVQCANGEEKELTAPKGVGGVTWAALARSIETLDPVKVELYDVSDKMLRATRFDSLPTKAETELPAVLARDAESARMVVFANLLSQAYKFSVEIAFTKMVELMERVETRGERMEVRLERMETTYRREMQARIDEAFEDADEAAKAAEQTKADPATALVQTFMGGLTQGQQETPEPSSQKSNGKGRHP